MPKESSEQLTKAMPQNAAGDHSDKLNITPHYWLCACSTDELCSSGPV